MTALIFAFAFILGPKLFFHAVINYVKDISNLP